MQQPRILVFSGSARSGSLNAALAALAAKKMSLANAEPTLISLRDYALPIYDGDLEQSEGVPENARRLAEHVISSDGLFITSPEYNGGYSPLLKNAIDWITRVPNEGGNVFSNRPTAIGAASPGSLGGIRGAMMLRQTLAVALGALVLGGQVVVPSAGKAFDDMGNLTDARSEASLNGMIEKLIRTASAMKDDRR